MKDLTMVVWFTVQVADDVDPDRLCLDFPRGTVKVIDTENQKELGTIRKHETVEVLPDDNNS